MEFKVSIVIKIVNNSANFENIVREVPVGISASIGGNRPFKSSKLVKCSVQFL